IVPMIISSDLGDTGQGPLGSTFPVNGSMPQDFNRKVSNFPFLPNFFKRKATRFRIRGTQVAVKSINVPSLSKMINRQGIRLSLYSIPITLRIPLWIIHTIPFVHVNPTFKKMGEYPLSKIGVLCYEYSSIKHGAISSYTMPYALCAMRFFYKGGDVDEAKKI